jgi:hypothetical protein
MSIGLLFLISSCNCFKIKNDIRRVWSLKFNECRCQWYSFRNASKIDDLKPCEDFFSENFPDSPQLPNHDYCDDLVGFSARSWAKNITPHARETIACVEDDTKCQK